MQGHNSYSDPSAGSPGAYETGATATSVDSTEPYVHPTIPLGLPHVVNFVEASLHHLPMSVRFVGDRMSRYANAQGVVSMAVPFICQITGLGSKNTAEHHIKVMTALGMLEKRPGKGGKDRKSNTYVFLGEQRNWKPLPTERPGTDPWIALAQARRENEELRAEIARLKNDLTIGHSGVTDGQEDKSPEPTSHSYDPPGYSASTEAHGAIGHSGVTDGQEAQGPEPTSHSYESPDYSASTETHGAIGHSRVTDGQEAEGPEPTSRSREAPDSEPSPSTREATGHSEVTGGSDAGQQYLARRARVETLVTEHRGYYDRSFRGGVLSAIHFFSLDSDNEEELLRQVSVLRDGQEPSPPGSRAVQEPERPPPREEPLTESGRREVEFCPDCNSPYTTFNGEERCPDCTDLRRRESEA